MSESPFVRTEVNTSHAPSTIKLTPVGDFIISDSDMACATKPGELKNCPHCGRWAFSIGSKSERGNYVYHVNCTGNDCMAQAFYCAGTEAEARAGAVRRWNRRARE